MPFTPPPSFTVCGAQTCPATTSRKIHRDDDDDTGDKEVIIAGQPTKCASPCECRIFRQKGKAGSWEFAFPDEHGLILRDKDYHYTAECVTPVLPGKTAGGTYALCASGSSAGDCKRQPKELSGKLRCPDLDTPCSAGCACTMFRLKKDDNTATWELAGEPGEKVKPEKGYHYECMCVK